MQPMSSPPNFVIVDDSSDEEIALARDRSSAQLLISSSDESDSSRPSQVKRPRVEPTSMVLSINDPSTLEVPEERSDSVENENDTNKPSAPHGKQELTLETTQQLVHQVSATTDSSTVQTGKTTQLTFADNDGRMYADAMSFSELQAQQFEFERLQAKAQRQLASVRQASAGTKQKERVAKSTPHSSPRSGFHSLVLKKTASRSPFDVGSSGSSDDLSSSSSVSSTDDARTAMLDSRAKLPCLKDVVAQERKLARLRREKLRNSSQAAPCKRNAKGVPKPKHAHKKATSNLLNWRDNVIDGTAWSESDSSDTEEDTTTEHHSKVSCRLSQDSLLEKSSGKVYTLSKTKASSAHSASNRVSYSKVKSCKAQKAIGAKRRRKAHDKKGDTKSKFASTVSKSYSSLPAQIGVVSDKLTHPRNARTTVIHITVWRNVYFDTFPTNLLQLPSTVAPPFYSEYDRPLLSYDVDGDLESKCALSPQNGKSTLFSASALESSKAEQSVTQEDMDTYVVEVIKREVPRLRACHGRKVAAILVEARSKVKQYLNAHKVFRRQWHPHGKRLGGVAIQERSLLNQMKRENLTPALSLEYFNVRGETPDVAKKLVVQDVNQLPSIQPLSKCTAYIGLKANVRIEDDPILRYKPYFGEDDDGADIDEAWYDAVAPKTSTLSSGLDGEVNELMLRLVVRECGATEPVFTALKKVPGFAQANSDYADIIKLNDSMRLAASRVKEAKDLISSESAGFSLTKVAALEPALCETEYSQKTLEKRLAPPLTHFDSNLARNHAHRGYGLGLRSTDTYAELLVTYRDMFCRMCYDYHCLEHGIEHPLPSHRVDPVHPPLHLSAVALAATRKEDNAKAFIQASDKDTLTVSPPANVNVPDSGNCSAEDQGEHEDVLTGDATVEDEVIEVRSETTTDEEMTSTGDLLETRRSTRTATKYNSMASRSYIKQATQSSRKKPSRSSRPQLYPPVADESEYLDDAYYAQVTAVVKRSLEADEKCSSECWKTRNFATASVGNAPNETESGASALSETELVLLRKLSVIIGDNPCMISSMVTSTTCKEVGAFLQSERQSKSSCTRPIDDMPLLANGCLTHTGRKRGRVQDSRTSNNRILLDRRRNNLVKDKRANHEYEPCNHEGACDASRCSCMTRDHTCDKACSCSRDCPNRFLGCKCSLGNCRTKACPCFVAARECNPDLCITCGASEVAALVYDEDRKHMSALDLGICCNVNILRGLHKKIGVAYSTTHGWGAFALESIKRGEFIYEYHGALLSQDEAERRGSIYDKMTISFLFDVNDDSVVDAIRKGNKSRFANHSTANKKCKGKVLTVKGDHRISIWAQQDIAKGEELFFDYGYHGETAPDWSQLRIKGSASSGSKKKMEGKDKKKKV